MRPVFTRDESDGASLVQVVKMRFYKRCRGERWFGSDERARRGGEGVILGGGYGGAYGGGEGGEVSVEKMGS